MAQPTYSRNPAENYERYFVPTIGGPVATDLIAAAELRPGERVLDVACGTGIVARLAAERIGPDGRLAALDVNPGMIAVARQATPPGVSIDWYESPAEKMPLPDNDFDVVLCGMGLQFFADRLAALREIRRVLAPGGRFVASLPGPAPPPLEMMREEIERHIGAEPASFVRAVFALHDAGEIRALVTEAGFTAVDVRSARRPLRLPPPADFLWQYVHSTPLVAAVAQVDEAHRAALERDFSARCETLLTDGALQGEVNMTTVIARK